eukprot:CAMPEP_0203755586 /NCGR_PEP_ID=MMETSP0098-20131031/9014_1 /ASSEMBLY_ACC=CAM_ASM_000208 /TAXON_ID=96639 /ORGANISM=" , Strain NY0313808BC1" /LENGTH=300 /DNA_ID=CAMNT_0050647115 /DNA_START=86 /DNA_END=988 /DNA_ORIENTATION=-
MLEKVIRQGYGSIDFTVNRDETDCLGVVYASHLKAWFVRGREEVISVKYLAQLYEETGESFVVTNSEQHFHKPAKYGDKVQVRTIPFCDGNYRLGFDQSIWNVTTQQKLVSGFVEMVAVSKEFKLVPLPKSLCQDLLKLEPCKANFEFVKLKGRGIPRKKKVEKCTGSVCVYPLVIYKADTDFTGIAYHPNYYRWFEQARSHSKMGNVLVALKESHNVGPVLRSVKIQYKTGARPYEQLQVVTTPVKEHSSRYVLGSEQVLYRVQDKEPLVVGFTEIVFVNLDSKLPVPIPEEILSVLEL